MKTELTKDSPILLRLVLETQLEVFRNGVLANILSNMKIPFKTRKDGTVILNIGLAQDLDQKNIPVKKTKRIEWNKESIGRF